MLRILANVKKQLIRTRLVKQGFVRKQSNTAVTKEDQDIRPFDAIPKVTSLPIVGSLWKFLPLIGPGVAGYFQIHQNIYREYGPIVRMDPQRGAQFVVLYNLDDIATMHRNEGKHPDRRGMHSLRMFRRLFKKEFKAGLLAMDGQDWADFRSKVQPYLMKPKMVMNYLPQMNVAANQLVDRIGKIKNNVGEVDNFLNEVYKWALESLGMVALDTRLGLIEGTGDQKAQKLIDSANAFITEGAILDMEAFSLWRIFKKPIGSRWRRYIRANIDAMEISLGYIKEAMERIKSGPVLNEDPSILQLLLSRDDFSIEDAIIMTIDLMMAGIDTTSHSVAFVLYNLAKNPCEQEKLSEEIRKVVGEGEDVTKEMLNDLRYLKACVKESMRLTPTISANIRVMHQEVIFSGYRCPKDTFILSVNHVTNRDAKYFDEPLKFRPERWLKTDPLFNDLHPFSLLPFGFGPRMCIGRRIAEQEIWLLVTKIIQKYKLSYHHEDIEIVTRLINTPDKPLRISFTRRN